jgi:Kef-type K+ transport system membrane component KefB
MSEALNTAPEGLLASLHFLPPFPERIDALALFSLLLLLGLLIGEWLQARAGWPKVIGYVLAGSLFGPWLLGWINAETLAQARPVADAALGLLMLEVGRRLELGWLLRHRPLIRSTSADVALSFLLIFLFAFYGVGLSPAWSAATAAVTMASAPAVVLLAVEQSKAQGQVTEHIILHTAISCAASLILFTLVLGVVDAEYSRNWLDALLHPLWVAAGALVTALLTAHLALGIARLLPKGSLTQVFVLFASAMLAVGIARMLAVPAFLTLFLMGVALALRDKRQSLRYTALPEGHWLLAIILFVVVGASLPWTAFTWITGLQALGLLAVRAIAKMAALALSGGSLPYRKRLLVGLGIQPLSATAVFMAHELAGLYPGIGLETLALPLFAAAIMELAGPALCALALRRAGECHDDHPTRGGIA